MAHLGGSRVVAGRDAIGDPGERAEVGIDAAQLIEMRRIQQIVFDAIDVVETLEVDAGGSDVAEFDNPVLGEFALHVQEPAFAVLGFDGGVHDEAGDLKARDSALRIQAARELLGIEGHGNSI